jgi:hypothetical protein
LPVVRRWIHHVGAVEAHTLRHMGDTHKMLLETRVIPRAEWQVDGGIGVRVAIGDDTVEHSDVLPIGARRCVRTLLLVEPLLSQRDASRERCDNNLRTLVVQIHVAKFLERLQQLQVREPAIWKEHFHG